jgi:hypothetical protein
LPPPTRVNSLYKRLARTSRSTTLKLQLRMCFSNVSLR